MVRAAQAEQEAQQRQMRRERFWKDVVTWAGHLQIRTLSEPAWTADPVDSATFMADGLAFCVRPPFSTLNDHAAIALMRACPKCGEVTYDWNTRTLLDLGEALADPELPLHRCAALNLIKAVEEILTPDP